MPALPRRRRARPPRGDEPGDDARLPRPAARTRHPDGRHHRRAPELNPHFRWLAAEARGLGAHVIDRCNLTILLTPGQQDLPEFLAEHQVEVVASLPYYLAENTDAQRGEGVFERSIEALRRLNELGYGRAGTGLTLNLVYNPVGPAPSAAGRARGRLPPRALGRHGVVFNRLYTITNMPISRFLDYLVRSGQYERYMETLVGAFNPAAAAGVMCRTTLSVGWDGRLYDCDFNQMLDLPLAPTLPRNIHDLGPDLDLEPLLRRPITTHQHCYGCTAGAGRAARGRSAGVDGRHVAGTGLPGRHSLAGGKTVCGSIQVITVGIFDHPAQRLHRLPLDPGLIDQDLGEAGQR